jgi:hypothetical protein
VLAGVIVVTAGLRGPRDAAFLRVAGVFAVVLAGWLAVRVTLPPDGYYASIIPAAEMNFFDPRKLLASEFFMVLIAALASYGIATLALRPIAPARAPMLAFGLVVLALAAYWLRFDHALHTQNRYDVRTVIFLTTPVLGGLAVLRALRLEGRLHPPARWMERLATILADGITMPSKGIPPRAAAGAILLLTLAHAVETTKFIAGWMRYETVVRDLAMGAASDPALGDPHFVSTDRIDSVTNRLRWQTTTPFLSVLLAPGHLPKRLVVDPTAGYFWLTCRKAAETEQADLPLPVEGRRFIRVYSCLHR